MRMFLPHDEHCLSELETSMSVLIDQKSYEMPPREGISIAFFLAVADIQRSLDYYEKVFGATILSSVAGPATDTIWGSICGASIHMPSRSMPCPSTSTGMRPRVR